LTTAEKNYNVSQNIDRVFIKLGVAQFNFTDDSS